VRPVPAAVWAPAPVPARPRQPIHPSRDVSSDLLARLSIAHRGLPSRRTDARPTDVRLLCSRDRSSGNSPRLVGRLRSSLLTDARRQARRPSGADHRSPAAQGRRCRGRVTCCRSHPWWMAQRRAGLYRGRAGRCSRPRRTFGFRQGAHHRSGAGGAASAIASQHHMLGLFPYPSRANASRPRRTACRLAAVVLGRLTPAGSSARVVLVDTVAAGLAGRGPKGSAPPGRRVVGCRASPDRRAGRGVSGSCEPARRAAVDPGLGGGLAVTELLARVGGRSVSLNCPGAD
jgi:hypothetical protein